MKQYIIKRKLKGSDWKNTKLYFQNVTENKSRETMNVFMEHLTKNKARAKRFYDKEEAEKFAKLFDDGSHSTSKVLTVNK